MTEYTFRLTLRGIELTDEQLDTLYEAGCDEVPSSWNQTAPSWASSTV